MLAVTIGAAVALLPGTASARAACTSSTPAATSYTDAVDGDDGLAPEITTVAVSVDAACHLVVDPGVAAPLRDGDVVLVYLDADGNPATGSSTVPGADVVVGTIATPGAASPPVRGIWNGTTFDFEDGEPVGTSVGNGGFSARLDALRIAPGATVSVVVASMSSGDHFDVAPDAGTISLRVDFEPDVLYTAQATQGCVVPRTKGLTFRRARAKLRAHGCSVASTPRRAWSATVRRGRVIRATGSGGRLRLVVSKGPRH